MAALLEVLAALFALLFVVFLAYGAWLCLPWVQRKPSAKGAAPTSLRKYLRSVSGRFSASNW